MTLKACTKTLAIGLLLILLPLTSVSQVTAGKITFERKTNLKKMLKDNKRMQAMGVELNTRIEKFELYFNDTASAFVPVEEPGGEQGWMRYLTSHNQIYKNFEKNEKKAVLDMMGTQMYVKDSIKARQWKITDRKRKLAGYLCRRAIWEPNDSTRVYAWFSVDVVPSVGPEGFSGLPGAILGLATEDGSIIYFAKEVEMMKPTAEQLNWDVKSKDVYTLDELKAILTEKMGKWVKPKDLEAMFAWL